VENFVKGITKGIGEMAEGGAGVRVTGGAD